MLRRYGPHIAVFEHVVLGIEHRRVEHRALQVVPHRVGFPALSKLGQAKAKEVHGVIAVDVAEPPEELGINAQAHITVVQHGPRHGLGMDRKACSDPVHAVREQRACQWAKNSWLNRT